MLHVALTTAEDPAMPHNVGKAALEAMRRIGVGNDRSAIYIHKWYMQFDHYAKADALRRAYGPHELVVRVRMDVELMWPLHLESFRSGQQRSSSSLRADASYSVALQQPNGTRTVLQRLHAGERHLDVGAFGSHAIKLPLASDGGGPRPTASETRCVPTGDGINLYGQTGSLKPQCPADLNAVEWMWSDWFFVGTAAALAPLASMTSRGIIFTSNVSRCYGLCQEEQTSLQLQEAGATLLPLRLPLRMHRVNANPCGYVPLLNLSELAAQHQISGWYAPCPPPARGCTRRPDGVVWSA